MMREEIIILDEILLEDSKVLLILSKIYKYCPFVCAYLIRVIKFGSLTRGNGERKCWDIEAQIAQIINTRNVAQKFSGGGTNISAVSQGFFFV